MPVQRNSGFDQAGFLTGNENIKCEQSTAR